MIDASKPTSTHTWLAAVLAALISALFFGLNAVASMLLAAIGWILSSASDFPAVRYLGLVFVSMGSFCGLLTFWTVPTSAAILSPDARPAGIELINCIGIGGGSAIGPIVIGYLKDLTGSFTSGLVYVVAIPRSSPARSVRHNRSEGQMTRRATFRLQHCSRSIHL